MEDLTAERDIRDIFNATLRRVNTSMESIGKLQIVNIPPGYRRAIIELVALLDKTEKLISKTLDETASLE